MKRLISVMVLLLAAGALPVFAQELLLPEEREPVGDVQPVPQCQSQNYTSTGSLAAALVAPRDSPVVLDSVKFAGRWLAGPGRDGTGDAFLGNTVTYKTGEGDCTVTLWYDYMADFPNSLNLISMQPNLRARVTYDSVSGLATSIELLSN